MSTKITDPTLGLDAQSRAVLHALSDSETPPGVDTSTSAWYNGREQGFVIEARLGFSYTKALFITCAECRNSDSIVVSHWRADGSINPPTHSDRPESAYQAEAYFAYLDLAGVTQHIRDLLKAFAGTQ